MPNALVVHKAKLPLHQKALRAAQYVRVSTDRQRYSIQNQAAVIAAYAHAHNMTIVRTYSDEGESGLRIKNRAGLTQLITDVRFGCADFNWILVYDVSRWGRFQDVDESAHYEFVCKRAGLRVAYCAEQFDNDGSMLSSIVKNLKRVMAAEYSRELSAKVRAGQRRLAGLGFKQGGPAGYALRRELVDENMRPKGLLRKGERKYLNSDRVKLRRGSADEIATVNWVFHQYIDEHKSAAEIARQLNQKAIPSERQGPWNCGMVSRLLRNESYIGNLVYNRMSRYLGQRAVSNPAHMWIRTLGVVEPTVEKRLFLSAQKIIRERRVDLTEDEMLDRLRNTLKRRGRLSTSIINDTVGLPSSATYMAHFGTMRNAYKLIGYTTKRDCDWIDSSQYWAGAMAKISTSLTAAIENAGGHAEINEPADGLLVSGKVGVAFRVARCTPGRLTSHSPRWTIQRRKHLAAGWIAAIRLAEANKAVLDYLLVPSNSLVDRTIKFTETARSRHRVRRFDTIEALVRAIITCLDKSGAVPANAMRLNIQPRSRRSTRKSASLP
ncbi:recombinase family protein [Bradyrhizobium canariense]|uniref:Site-specific DNA recombinase n=1 Tax=Bradyrhizobium canariense TaxID=255045 RepID=A0A1H1UXU1_9BRAD|nr:recombinase family protein [Bradyrhizobium canariense]SDS77352.1 Site-specific DNA recombinase [Bradyrhizobium canariense]